MYCPTYLSYLSNVQDTEDAGASLVPCTHCGCNHNEETLLKSGSYFVTLSIGCQVRELFEQHGLRARNCKLTFAVADIAESLAYNRPPIVDSDISVTWNTDAVSESSGFSILPLQFQVNEMPFKSRTENIIIGGLWFGPSNLKPFVHKMNNLSSHGVFWKSKVGNEELSRVFPGPCSVDSVGRGLVMNMTQFKGKHGCGWCEARGEQMAVGRGSARVYPLQRPRPKSRT